jgi:predicted DsbA family dithiol-disulfide isomerase
VLLDAAEEAGLDRQEAKKAALAAVDASKKRCWLMMSSSFDMDFKHRNMGICQWIQ